MHLVPFFTLLRHQLRLLAQNRSACLVLLMFVALASCGRRIHEPTTPACYILYWQDDPWIQCLKAELPTCSQRLEVKVAPVEQFVNERGVITYPDGAHSIQLRPPTDQRDHWVIWFWYSGAQVDVLEPVTDWFWSVTQRHFRGGVPMHVRVSSLRPEFPLLEVLGPSVRSFIDRGHWKGPVVLAAIFFCGCYLTAMALVQQRENRTIYSLVTTPVGWAGVGLSTAVFYGTVTTIVSLSVALALGHRAGSGLWATVLLATLLYISVGFTLGCWCGGTASASAAMLVYLAFSVGFAWIARAVPALQGSSASIELQVLQMLQETPTIPAGVPVSLAIWVPSWFLVACLSFRRLKVR
jgi:hypothetical protein